ncbi:histidine phosphatase family protein, partial [Jatrophihabitans sp.]|uniref:histidine phosphatase family protein n=1 Tax=Jatrophihabitans sp. TaxID=1932789 RepID=UPI002F22BB3F
MLRRLVILRHGRTAWNAERRYQGQEDPPLDQVGLAQALESAALIAAMDPDLLVSSDLRRAKQTAEKIAALTGQELMYDTRLRERHLGHWQGLTRSQEQARYPEEFADRLAGRDVTRRGGESRQEVATRAVKALGELPEVELTVLVSHGATSMCLAAALL